MRIFDDVLATDENINLAGSAKAKALTDRSGYRGFDYVGNSHADLSVWANAHRVIVVNRFLIFGAKGKQSF